MALIPNDAATPEAEEALLRALRDIRLGRHRDGNEALKQMCTAMEKAATNKLAPPTLTSLEPATATIGDPSFTLRVLGTDFDAESVIVFNGFDEPTTLVSSTEVTTGVNMAVWKGASEPLPVIVRGIGGESNALTFTFAAAAPPADEPVGTTAGYPTKGKLGREAAAHDRELAKGEKERGAAHS